MDKINYLEFFIINNSSGWKTVEKKLNNYDSDLVSKILLFNDTDILRNLPFKTKVWHFIFQRKDIPKCECGKEIKFGRSINEGYNQYCSLSCTNKSKSHINKVSKSLIENHGGIGMASESITKAVEKTNEKKYGVKNIFEDKEYIESKMIEKYGVRNSMMLKSVREKSLKTTLSRTKKNFINQYPNCNFVNVHSNILNIICDKCNNEFNINRTTFKFRINNQLPICTICNPINFANSLIQTNILEYITSIYGDTIISNDSEIIKPKHIDIFLPNKKIGIELNGLYWHNEIYKTNDYHYNKFLSSQKSGIHLIQIFEDEWRNKSDVVKSIINSNLNIFNKTIYGRKCKIKEISPRESNQFLENNHIQGSTNAKIKLGLYYGDELVSIMTFGSFRKSLGSKHTDPNEYEMIRFCNKINTKVIGGASKLFTYFLKNYKPKTIISYSDNRYFDGKLYEILGFNFIKLTKPNYFYTKDFKIRENRFKYRKDRLIVDGFDKNKTEHEIMNDRNYYQIYDAGNKKWEFNIISPQPRL